MKAKALVVWKDGFHVHENIDVEDTAVIADTGVLKVSELDAKGRRCNVTFYATGTGFTRCEVAVDYEDEA